VGRRYDKRGVFIYCGVKMMIDVTVIENNKRDFLDLLLLADEQEAMINKYLERGELFALYDGGLKSVCVVTRESDDICELKNIATYSEWHGQGYGSKLLSYIFTYYRDKYQAMLVGTGDVPWILEFYQKNGFRTSHRIANFFTDNYDHPMFDNGVQLVDMVYLKRNLC
jgi:GNAT superfamily N-acetyltransferase